MFFRKKNQVLEDIIVVLMQELVLPLPYAEVILRVAEGKNKEAAEWLRKEMRKLEEEKRELKRRIWEEGNPSLYDEIDDINRELTIYDRILEVLEEG